MDQRKIFIIFVMVGMLLCGASNTITAKWQDEFRIDGQKFNHPFMQTNAMFLSEMMVGVFYLIKCKLAPSSQYLENRDKAQRDGKLSKYQIFYLLIPATCDLTATGVQFLGLLSVPSSVYQMLRGGVIVIVAILSVLILKRRLYSHNYLGIFLVITGVSMVGLSAILSDSQNGGGDQTFGVILITGSLIFQAGLFVSEEIIFRKRHFEPMQCVGGEGLFGFFGCLIVNIILTNMKGDVKTDNNSYYEGYYYIDNIFLYFNQFNQDSIKIFYEDLLKIAIFSTMLSIGSFNVFGVIVTQEINSLTRSIMDVARTLIIWVFELAIGWSEFSLLQLFGFIIMVLGNFIYNEILEIPFLGLDRNLKKNMKEQRSKLLSVNQESRQLLSGSNL